MIPVIDLFHQRLYEDADFVVVANYTEQFISYNVYCKQNSNWIGCTNCDNWEPQIRMIINWYLKSFGIGAAYAQVVSDHSSGRS